VYTLLTTIPFETEYIVLSTPKTYLRLYDWFSESIDFLYIYPTFRRNGVYLLKNH